MVRGRRWSGRVFITDACTGARDVAPPQQERAAAGAATSAAVPSANDLDDTMEVDANTSIMTNGSVS